MAAEASADAQFPVYLALIKLAFEFSIDWLGKVNLFYILLTFTYQCLNRLTFINIFITPKLT